VLLTTLWIITVAAVIALGAALIGRHAVLAGAARVELERARWQALGCERRVAAAIDFALDSAPTTADEQIVWRILPRTVLGSPLLAGCDVSLEAAGTRLDVNHASEEMLTRLFDAIGLDAEALPLADALEDWIDPDDDRRPFGAEREWYESAGRLVPRNDSLADIRELSRVRGFDTIGAVDSLATTSPGRVSLATAPVSVLMAVPGITRETAEVIVAMQRAGTPIDALRSIVGSISQESASELAARYADAERLTTPDPDAWLVRVQVARGQPAVAVRLEWRVIRAGRSCIVASTRSEL
jgi:type II secretory pathway component PulK